jgi:formylglycine-generating enzyme required for sulfatase activity
VDFHLHRDLAASTAGATVASHTGVGFFTGCAPAQALDLDQATGWSTNVAAGTNIAPSGTFHAKNLVVDLGGTFDLSGFGVDPSATCTDGGSASTGAYRIETSASASGPWTQVKAGTFTPADDGRINQITPDSPAHGVRFVRFWMDSNQVPSFGTNCPNGAYSGCVFVDLTELQVYGAPTP